MNKSAALVIAVMFLAGAASALSPGADIVVPAAISAGGAGGSFWIMDLFLDNPGDKLARVDVYWLARGQDNSTAEPTRVVVPANGTVVLEDVVSNTLGVQGVGALRLRSNVLIGATARFVNTVSQAGQGFEGIDFGGRVESNEWVRVAGLREGDGARSNLFGVAGGDGVTYEVHFYITPDGLIYGMSENVPSPSIESVTYNGRIEDGKIMIQSLIRFPGGSAPAQSYLEVTRR